MLLSSGVVPDNFFLGQTQAHGSLEQCLWAYVVPGEKTVHSCAGTTHYIKYTYKLYDWITQVLSGHDVSIFWWERNLHSYLPSFSRVLRPVLFAGVVSMFHINGLSRSTVLRYQGVNLYRRGSFSYSGNSVWILPISKSDKCIVLTLVAMRHMFTYNELIYFSPAGQWYWNIKETK